MRLMSCGGIGEEVVEKPCHTHEARANWLRKATVSGETSVESNIRFHSYTVAQALRSPPGEAMRSCILILIGAILCVNSPGFESNSPGFESNSPGFELDLSQLKPAGPPAES